MEYLYFKGKKYILDDNQLFEDDAINQEFTVKIPSFKDIDSKYKNKNQDDLQDSSIADSSTLYAPDNIVLPTVNP